MQFSDRERKMIRGFRWSTDSMGLREQTVPRSRGRGFQGEKSKYRIRPWRGWATARGSAWLAWGEQGGG